MLGNDYLNSVLTNIQAFKGSVYWNSTIASLNAEGILGNCETFTNNLIKVIDKTNDLLDLIKEYNELNKRVIDIDAQISLLEGDISSLESAMANDDTVDYSSEIASKGSEISALNEERSQIKEKMRILKTNIESSYSEINEIDLEMPTSDTGVSASTDVAIDVNIQSLIEAAQYFVNSINSNPDDTNASISVTVADDLSSVDVQGVLSKVRNKKVELLNSLNTICKNINGYAQALSGIEGIELPLVDNISVTYDTFSNKDEYVIGSDGSSYSPSNTTIKDIDYTVQPGDSLWKLAQEYYGDGDRYYEIIAANPGINPDVISVGTSLVIPGVTVVSNTTTYSATSSLKETDNTDEKKTNSLDEDDIITIEDIADTVKKDSSDTNSNKETITDNSSKDTNGKTAVTLDDVINPDNKDKFTVENLSKLSSGDDVSFNVETVGDHSIIDNDGQVVARNLSEHAQDIDRYIYNKAKEKGMNDYQARLAVAISRWETGHYTSSKCRNDNNPGGITNGGLANGFKKYDTTEEGVSDFLDILKNKYFIDPNRDYSDQESLAKISAKYCGDGSNWEGGVGSIYNSDYVKVGLNI